MKDTDQILLEQLTIDILTEDYVKRNGDLWFHGSPKDFDIHDISAEKGFKHEKNGLLYLTRNLNHAIKYSKTHPEFGSRNPSKAGFVYAYKLNPNAKIFDTTDRKSLKELGLKNTYTYDDNGTHKTVVLPYDRPADYGDTEAIQDPDGKDFIKDVLTAGYNGIIQKQADRDYYGEYSKPTVKRKAPADKKWNPGEKRRVYHKSFPSEHNDDYFGFSGFQVLGIDPKFLIPFKKISSQDMYDDPEKEESSEQYRRFK